MDCRNSERLHGGPMAHRVSRDVSRTPVVIAVIRVCSFGCVRTTRAAAFFLTLFFVYVGCCFTCLVCLISFSFPFPLNVSGTGTPRWRALDQTQQHRSRF